MSYRYRSDIYCTLKSLTVFPQDALGQYNYGYSDPNSAKQEVKTADGVVRGSYSYVDANGLVQTVNYLGRRIAKWHSLVSNI